MLGGVGHEVRGGSRQGGVRSSGASARPRQRGPWLSQRHARRPGDLGGLGQDLLQSSAGRMGALSAPPDPREASMSRRT